jgi:hypothetical protein
LRVTVWTLLTFAVATAPAPGRDARLTVLLSAPVADAALGSIAPQAWAKYVAASLGRYRVVTLTGALAVPALADCRKLHADYLVTAEFELRPRLPGLPNDAGRIPAQARLHILDCVTGTAASDHVIPFESEPVERASVDDDATSDARWDREIPAALALHPIALQRPAITVRP